MNYDVGSNNGWGTTNCSIIPKRRREMPVLENGYRLSKRVGNKDSLSLHSARLVTRGKGFLDIRQNFVRAKLPAGRGTWPAIWMLAENMKTRPDDGEIDIMEHVGFHPGYIHASGTLQNYNHIIGT